MRHGTAGHRAELTASANGTSCRGGLVGNRRASKRVYLTMDEYPDITAMRITEVFERGWWEIGWERLAAQSVWVCSLHD